MAAEIDSGSKGLLGAFSIFILGSGLTTLVYGILLALRYLTLQYSYGTGNLTLASLALIIIGCLLIITLILGIFGAWKNSSPLRLFTLILTFILFLVLIITGIWMMYVVQTGQLKTSVESEINGFSGDYKSLTEQLKAKADYLHGRFKCCVINVATSEVENIPDSCCQTAGCEESVLGDKSKYFQDRCIDKYLDMKSKTVYQLSIVALATGVATLLALIVYAILYQRQAHAGYAGVSRG